MIGSFLWAAFGPVGGEKIPRMTRKEAKALLQQIEADEVEQRAAEWWWPR